METMYITVYARYTSVPTKNIILGCFTLRRERDRVEAPDKLTPKLKVDDCPLESNF